MGMPYPGTAAIPALGFQGGLLRDYGDRIHAGIQQLADIAIQPEGKPNRIGFWFSSLNHRTGRHTAIPANRNISYQGVRFAKDHLGQFDSV